MITNKEIKVGIYRNGSHIRYVAECDLINQDNGHKDEAIYLIEITVVKNPDENWTDADTKRVYTAVTRAFADNSLSFKAKDRDEADKFIEFHTKNWNCIDEFHTISTIKEEA